MIIPLSHLVSNCITINSKEIEGKTGQVLRLARQGKHWHESIMFNYSFKLHSTGEGI